MIPISPYWCIKGLKKLLAMSLRLPKLEQHPQETAQRPDSILKGALQGELLVQNKRLL